MRKAKIEEIETLRGFAFMAVVLQHAIGHYYVVPSATLADGVLLGFILLLTKFAVPVFIFITGLVLFYNYDRDIRYGAFVRKRFKDVLLPYIPWAVLYGVLFHNLNLFEAGSLSELGIMILTGKSSYHLWYIVMIFQLYLLFPLLLKLVKRTKPISFRNAMWIVLALGIIYLGLMSSKGIIYETAAAWDIPILTPWFTTYLDRNALMFFFYFALGAVAGHYIEELRAWLIRYRYLIMSLFAIAMLVMLYRVISHFQISPNLVIKYDDLLLLTPNMAVFLTLSVAAVYIGSMYFSQGAPVFLRKLLDLAGSYSYVGYLAHAYMLTLAYDILDSSFPGTSVTILTLMSFALSTVGSILIAYLIRLVARQVKAYRKR